LAIQQLVLGVLLVVGLAAYWSAWILLLAPLLLWYPVSEIVAHRYARSNSYFVRDWKGLPQVGEYAVMRDYLFFRVPNLSEVWVKPTEVSRVDQKTFAVRGNWLKRYRVFLADEATGDNFAERVGALINVS
jgi:hypothetical protein